MYEFLIRDYVNKLTIEDIKYYSNNNNIYLNDDELKIVFNLIKGNWKSIYYGNEETFIYLKTKINKEAYTKILDLYKNFKTKYKK